MEQDKETPFSISDLRQALESQGPFSPEEERDFYKRFDEGGLTLQEKMIGLYRSGARYVPSEQSRNLDVVSAEIVRGCREGFKME
jgi:hypothetical protein